MRKLALLSCLLALPAQAQVPSWIACSHTRTDEKLVEVRVALIEAGATSDGKQYGKDPVVFKAPLKTQVAVFEPVAVATKIIGMRFTCVWLMPPPLTRDVSIRTHYWEKPLSASVGAVPKLTVTVVETAPGLWRAFIGKAP